MKIIYIEEFSKFPGPRYAVLGEYSGETFRDKVLIPALNQHDQISVNFDGVFGFGSSFLEEAFGGLLRNGVERKKVEQLKNNLISSDPSIVDEVKSYIDDALRGN
ncbi:hypothetical protein KU75_16890 [Pectobacterium odoriferum]|uniref:DUF4325 domain-containing protein n=1 Tax=Pectobacterium odoriferum TaxID=78398 RepID=A0ABR4VLX7_9GAMM|nr:STAS-like domain-containing protein [Pectobacterium odoriferum]KGA40411.1 hypothetical protein KU75_16890 [Pectobacterium odoriferum]